MANSIYLVGLTGPTGAGKSTVSHIFQEKGHYVIDSDQVARQVVEKGSEGLQQLCEAFTNVILTKDGFLDRKALAEIAFSNPQSTQRLNEITHPLITQRISSILKEREQQGGMVILDAPLLYEAGLDRICDRTVAVVAGDEIRLQRIMHRDGLDRTHALMRMKAQKSSDFYTSKADDVIENDGDNRALRDAADRLEKMLRRAANEKTQD